MPVMGFGSRWLSATITSRFGVKLVCAVLAFGLTACPAPASVESVVLRMTPPTILRPGQVATLDAVITGDGNFEPAVDWNVSPVGYTSSLSRTNDLQAVFNAPVVTGRVNVTVRATTRTDPSKYAEITVPLEPAPVTPPPAPPPTQGIRITGFSSVVSGLVDPGPALDPGGEPVTRVAWQMLSGTKLLWENTSVAAPWCWLGPMPGAPSVCMPWTTTLAANGDYTVRATATLVDGTTRTTEVQFTLANGVQPAPPPPPGPPGPPPPPAPSLEFLNLAPNQVLTGIMQPGPGVIVRNASISLVRVEVVKSDGSTDWSREETKPLACINGDVNNICNALMSTQRPNGQYSFRATANLIGGQTLTGSIPFEIFNPPGAIRITGLTGTVSGVIDPGPALEVTNLSLQGVQWEIFNAANTRLWTTTDTGPPWCFLGKATYLVNTCNPWTTTQIANGDYTVKATATLSDGTTRPTQTTFTVRNLTSPPPPPPPPPPPAGSIAIRGFGSVVSGVIDPGPNLETAGLNVTRVFWEIINPSGTKLWDNTETSAPWCWLGKSPGQPNVCIPWTTTPYPNGDYTVKATATLADNTSRNTQVGFRIANAAPPPPPPPPPPGPPGASVRVQVEVPTNMRYGEFSQARYLNVPSGYKISVIGRLERPRFLLLAPNGDVLISQPSTGKIVLMRKNGTEYSFSDFASGLKKPHDLVFAAFGGTTYLYVTESNRITRSVFQTGDTTRRAAQDIVINLPDGNSSSALQGQYGHELKSVAISQSGKMFVGIASSSNADPADLTFNPKQGAIYEFPAQSLTDARSGGRLVGQGLRNPTGITFYPGTEQLFVNVVGRDDIAYPFNNDFDGDGQSDLGKVMQSYVDVNPPEMFVKLRDGGNYGWPLCNAVQNAGGGFTNMSFVPDYVNNRDNSVFNCQTADRAINGYPAHTTPLGITFLMNSAFSSTYRQGAISVLRACWNCSRFVGSKVVWIPFDASGNPGDPIDLVTGWIEDPVARLRYGAPVDAIPDLDGNLIISDDGSGTIYRLSPI